MNSGTVNKQSKHSNRIDVDPNRLYTRRKEPTNIAGLNRLGFSAVFMRVTSRVGMSGL
jgi:hypothetical protein